MGKLRGILAGFLIIGISAMAAALPADFMLKVDAGGRMGSRAARRLTLFADGNGIYEYIPPDNRSTGTPSETQAFTVSSVDLECLYNEVQSRGFFSLANEYNGGTEDGTYCKITVRADGIIHSVLTLNYPEDTIDTLARFVNGMVPPNAQVKYNAIFGLTPLSCGVLEKAEAQSSKRDLGVGFPMPDLGVLNTTVSRVGCNITITLNLEFSGEAASASNAQTIASDIGGVWSGLTTGVCNCPVTVTVNTRIRGAGDPPTAGFHQITLVNGGSHPDDHISTATITPPGSSGNGTWDMNEPNNTYAHEAGHLMGLPDQYTEGQNANGDRTTTPNPGHENDIMASLDGSPQQAAVDSVVAAGGESCPMECCTPSPSPSPSPSPTPEATIPVPNDSDGDGIPDEVEKKVPESGQTNMYLCDSDGDGLCDGNEDKNRNGIHRETGETDPRARDTDEDGYEDGIEVLLLDADPLFPGNPPLPYQDLDHDAIPDFQDPEPGMPDMDEDRFLDGYEACVMGWGAIFMPMVRPPLGDVDGNLFWDNADSQIILNWFGNNPWPGTRHAQTDLDRNAIIDNADSQQALNFFGRQILFLPAK